MLWFRRDLSEPNLQPAATHCAPSREAMLWSLDECSGEQFTPVMHRARGDVYDRLAVAMGEPLPTESTTRRRR